LWQQWLAFGGVFLGYCAHKTFLIITRFSNCAYFINDVSMGQESTSPRNTILHSVSFVKRHRALSAMALTWYRHFLQSTSFMSIYLYDVVTTIIIEQGKSFIDKKITDCECRVGSERLQAFRALKAKREAASVHGSRCR
jgi:hypothetical protein